MLSLLSYLVMPFCSEWKCLLLGGSRLPSEQLKPSLLLLHVPSSSSPFTMGLPHPLNHLTTFPSDRRTDSRMHMCMPVCAQKKKICKHTLDRLGCRGCAFMLYLCRQTATECACVTQEETEARVALTTVAVLCLCLCVQFHPFTKRLETFLNVSNPKPETNSQTDAEGLRLSTFAHTRAL